MQTLPLDDVCKEAAARQQPMLVGRGGAIDLPWSTSSRPHSSFGLAGDWVTVGDGIDGDDATLVVPLREDALTGIARETLRLFRLGHPKGRFEKIHRAVRHARHAVVYARVRKGGAYGLIGLPLHPAVRKTVEALCALRPIARALPEPSRRSLRDRVCDVILCAGDMQPVWDSRDHRQSMLPRALGPGETMCDRCRGIDILDLPECQILKEPAPRDDSPLGAGRFAAGFRLLSNVPVSASLQGISTLINGVSFATPAANAAVVFYPAASEGQNAPVAEGRFPLIIFGHAKRIPGTSQPLDTAQDFRQLSGILAHLARWGFVSIAPDLSWLIMNFGPPQQVALEDGGRHMIAESSRAGSPFKDRIRTSGVAVMGHSVGGLAATLVTAGGVLPVDALALLAPAADPASLADIAAFAPKPAIVFHGTDDTSSVGNGNDALALFAAAGPAKHLVTIAGANHFGYTDNIHDLNDTATLGQPDQQRIATGFLAAFFRRYLLADAGMADYLSGDRTIEGLEVFEIDVDAELA